MSTWHHTHNKMYQILFLHTVCKAIKNWRWERPRNETTCCYVVCGRLISTGRNTLLVALNEQHRKLLPFCSKSSGPILITSCSRIHTPGESGNEATSDVCLMVCMIFILPHSLIRVVSCPLPSLFFPVLSLWVRPPTMKVSLPLLYSPFTLDTANLRKKKIQGSTSMFAFRSGGAWEWG